MAAFGHPGGKCAQTADRGSVMAAFGALEKNGHRTSDHSSYMATVSKLQTLAVLWPLLGPSKTSYYIEEILTDFRYFDGYK